jgi:hypothetical protein
MQIPFFDLPSEYETFHQKIDAAINRVIKSGWFVAQHGEVRIVHPVAPAASRVGRFGQAS